MTNKHLFLAGIIAVVVLGFGYFGFQAIKSESAPALGAPQGYQALNQQNLLNELTNNFNDITSLRTSVAANVYTAVYTVPALGISGSSTATNSLLVNATNTAADFLYASFATTTNPYIKVGVSPYSATQVLVSFTNTSSTPTSAQGASSTITIWDIPSASAFQPAVLTQ